MITSAKLIAIIAHYLSLPPPDNNLKTRIVAQAIVDDESQLSYEWVFRCVKDATGVSPKVFVTDGDPAVDDTVVMEFPNTYHIHCI